MLSHKYVTTFTPRESWRSHLWDKMISETGLSTLDISRAKRAPNANNFVDMRLVLVFLATFLQSLFNLFNEQNLFGHSYGRSRQKALLDIVMAGRDKRVALAFVAGTR